MNLQQLGYFVAVARARNFTRAAELCFVAQPALSQQIGKLEQELGLPVFERRRRGVDLTVAGTEFLVYAEQVLQLVAEGKQRVTDLRKVRHGVLGLMCLPTVATYWLPMVISRYRQHFPDVEIQIHEYPGCTPHDFGNAIADLGIVQLGEDSGARSNRPVQVERLFIDEQVLIFPATHPLASSGDEAVSLKAVRGESFILTKPNCGMSRVIAKAFAEAGIQPKVRLETSQVEAVYEMVLAGLGIGLMPAMAMRRDYPNLRWRRIKKPVPSRTIALAWPSDQSRSPAASAFSKIVREVAGQSGTVTDARAVARNGKRKALGARPATPAYAPA
ncbi:MAG: LysR family transcriptional regulator [Betaproteobacteria bacterium]|nr:LysR family transcriptional regulator [Betaproteobacteria bacterium]